MISSDVPVADDQGQRVPVLLQSGRDFVFNLNRLPGSSSRRQPDG